MLFFLAVAGIVLLVYVMSKSHKSQPQSRFQSNTDSGEWEKIRNHPEGSWREENGPGSFTIYDKKGAGTVAKTYDGGERYIDGHKCSSADDMAKWYAKKGLSEGYERRLTEIEYQLRKLNTDEGDLLLNEWNERYEAYRQLCIAHGFWNWVIGDRTTFVPTSNQMQLEKNKKDQILKMHGDWKQRMLENRILLDYLEKCPRKHALKNQLIKELSGNDPEKKKKIMVIYRRLKTADVIAEKQADNGSIETRIVVRRKKSDKPLKPLPASVYHPEQYSHIVKSDVYKADYSVNPPENLDRTANTCQFTSKSSGEVYRTSLEKCTCPAYCRGGACKHMLALAMNLGYFDRSSVK